MPTAKVLTFSIQSSTTNADGLTVTRTIFSTHSEAALDAMLAAIKTAGEALPKTRPPTPGNSRPVKIIDIEVKDYARAVAAGRIPAGLSVGMTWPTLGDAAVALTLEPASLRQLFYTERKDNNGIDKSVWVRGVEVEYADSRKDAVSE